MVWKVNKTLHYFIYNCSDFSLLLARQSSYCTVTQSCCTVHNRTHAQTDFVNKLTKTSSKEEILYKKDALYKEEILYKEDTL